MQEVDNNFYQTKEQKNAFNKDNEQEENILSYIDKERDKNIYYEKMNKVDAELSVLKSQVETLYRHTQRPIFADNSSDKVNGSYQKKEFIDRYLRKGFDRGIEEKSFNSSVSAEGGYTIPQEIDQLINARLRDISPLRKISQVVQVGTSGYRKLVSNTTLSSGWASEIAARPETSATTFSEIVPPSGELYANPSATQAMLDDSVFDVEQWLAEEVSRDFAQKEGAAFVSGNGSAKPKGFLTYPTASTTDSVRSFGTLQYIPTGTAGAFPSTNPADKLIDLVHSLRAPYRQGAVFVMNSKTLSSVRKFKTTDGAFLWQPSLQLGASNTILGYPVLEAEDMPDIAIDSFSVAFGNFKSGYIIADRTGIRLLRDPYTNKPYVNFYVTKRTGGAVTNSDCIKLMKFSAS